MWVIKNRNCFFYLNEGINIETSLSGRQKKQTNKKKTEKKKNHIISRIMKFPFHPHIKFIPEKPGTTFNAKLISKLKCKKKKKKKMEWRRTENQLPTNKPLFRLGKMESHA